MAKFAAILTYSDDVDRKLKVRPEHRAYLTKLLNQGKIWESGPFGTDDGALIVYEAEDEAEARKLLGDDPFSLNGVIAKVELHEWKIIFTHTDATS